MESPQEVLNPENKSQPMDKPDATVMLFIALGVVLLACITTSFFLLTDANEANDQVVPLILAGTVWCSAGLVLFSKFFMSLHDSMNSRLSELVIETRRATRAETQLEEREASRRHSQGGSLKE